MKESFILYNSFYEPIKALKNEQLGKLLRAIFNYTINGEITQDNEILIAFMFIKNQIDIDTDKWQEEKQKRSEAGRLGGIQRAINKGKNISSKSKQCLNMLSNAKQSQANQGDNVNDNVISSSSNNIYTYIEDNFSRLLTPIEYQEISKWEDNELTRYAIKDAVLNGKYNIKYISAILDNYKKNSIITVQQAQEETKRHKEQKKYKSSYDKANEVYERFLGGES